MSESHRSGSNQHEGNRYEDFLDILYEDNHCIAINKPVGWPTTHYNGREETIDRLVKSYIKEKYNKPGEVFLGVVHRLDKPVSGVLLFARTSKSAARLSLQFREHSIVKIYWAIIEGTLKPECGTLHDWLSTPPDWQKEQRPITISPIETPESKMAISAYQIKATHQGLSWVELHPHTGRKHQLRVQMSQRGHAIYGDEKYGSNFSFGHGIALHAHSLTFLHPIRQEPITLIANPPKNWLGRFAYLLHRQKQ